MKSFKASVFQGSSLVATVEDLRGLLEVGQEVFVNGTPYLTHSTKYPFKWPSKTVELSADYAGESDLAAEIAFLPKARGTKKLQPIVLERKTSKQKDNMPAEVGSQVGDSLEPVPKPPVEANIQTESTKRKPSARKITERKELPKKPSQEVHGDADLPSKKEGVQLSQHENKKVQPNREVKLIRTQTSKVVAPNSTTAPSSSTPRNVDDKDDVSVDSVGNSTLKSLDEARKLAHERVLKKMQEDRKAVEQREEARQKALLERIEKNQIKIRQLQEKTLQRVSDYKSGKERMKEEKERMLEEKTYVLQLDQEKVHSEEYTRKMKKLHKEAARRLERYQDKELQEIERQELEHKEKLKRIKEERDQNTTFRVARRQKTIYVHNVDEDSNAVFENEDDAMSNAEHRMSKAQLAGGEYGDYLPARTPPARIARSLQADVFEEDSLIYSPTNNNHNNLAHSPSAYIFRSDPQHAPVQSPTQPPVPTHASSSSMQRPSTVGSSDVNASSLYGAHSQGPMVGTKVAFPPEKPAQSTASSKSPGKSKGSKVDLRDDSLFRPEDLNPDLVFEPPSPVAPPSVVARIIEQERRQAVHDDDSSSGGELDVPPNALRNGNDRRHRSEHQKVKVGEAAGGRRAASAESDSSNFSDITIEESPRRNYRNNPPKDASAPRHKAEQHSHRNPSTQHEVTGLFHKVSLPLLEPFTQMPPVQNISSNKSNASGSTKKSKAGSFKRLQPIPIAPYQVVHKPPL